MWSSKNHQPPEDSKQFNSVTVQPITGYNYLCEKTDYKEANNLRWATTVSREGINFDLPQSIKKLPLPFYETQPTPELDVAVRDLILQNILVENNNVLCAFQLITLPQPDSTYDVVQDFQYLTQFYPKKQYIKVINNSKFIQRVAPEDKMIKLKLTNIFAQIQISEETQKLFGIKYNGKLYSMTRLSPQHPRSGHIAQRWAEVVGSVIESKFNVYTVIYLDQWLIHANQINCRKIINFIQHYLGVSINMQQSVIEPTEEIEFFHVMVNSKNQSVHLTEAAKCKLSSCISELQEYDLNARDEVACLWWWVAYHMRLPRHIENEIIVGKSNLLAITMSQFDFSQLKQLKRAHRNIVICADVLRGRAIAYAPEFNRELNKEIEPTSATDSKTTALMAAIESAIWALDFIPNGVDLTVYVNCLATFLTLIKGNFENLQPIITLYLQLYKEVKSRNIVWQCSKSETSVKVLLQLFDTFHVPQHLCTQLIPHLFNSKTTPVELKSMCRKKVLQGMNNQFSKKKKKSCDMSLPYTSTSMLNGPSSLVNNNIQITKSVVFVNCSFTHSVQELGDQQVKEQLLANWILQGKKSASHRPIYLPLPPWSSQVLPSTNNIHLPD